MLLIKTGHFLANTLSENKMKLDLLWLNWSNLKSDNYCIERIIQSNFSQLGRERRAMRGCSMFRLICFTIKHSLLQVEVNEIFYITLRDIVRSHYALTRRHDSHENFRTARENSFNERKYQQRTSEPLEQWLQFLKGNY